MAESYRFFASAAGDQRAYGQTEMAEVLARLFRNGVFPGQDAELGVTASSPAAMSVEVSAGAAWVQGYYYRNDAPKTITLVAADPNNPRIDRIVLRLNVFAGRKITAERLTGTPAASPLPPALTRNNDYWELSLAQVYVAANATAIQAADITDERGDANLCGQAIPPRVGEALAQHLNAAGFKITDLLDPQQNQDAATKIYVDAVQSNLDTHIGSQAAGVHGSTSAPTANTLVHRDASGRAQVADPAAAADAATKAYADTKLALAGGTMTGQLVAQNNTDYTTFQVRNIVVSTVDPSGGGNGDVWIKYTA